jgi:hypothetical protein
MLVPPHSPRATPILVAPHAANFAGVRVAERAARAPVVVVIPVLLEEDLGFGQTGEHPCWFNNSCL